MEKVIVDYNNLRDAEMLSFTRIIIQHMDTNLNFPTPVPAVAVFVKTTADYETALTDAGNNDRQAVSRKNTLKATVAGGLRNWAMYENTVAQGNLNQLNPHCSYP